MTNIANLIQSKNDPKKGEPPKKQDNFDNLSKSPQNGKEAFKTLQFRLPESIVNEFSQSAAKEFGFTHGAKTKYFLKLFNHR